MIALIQACSVITLFLAGYFCREVEYNRRNKVSSAKDEVADVAE